MLLVNLLVPLFTYANTNTIPLSLSRKLIVICVSYFLYHFKMATSIFIGSCSSSDFDNPRKEMELSFMNGSGDKPTRTNGKLSGGGGGGRRKSKLKESQKKEKKPKRGMGVEKLERLSFQDRINKMTAINTLHPLSFQNQHLTTLPTTPAFGAYSFMSGGDGVGLVGCNPQQSALYMLQGLRNGGMVHNHGPVVSSDQRFLADPFGVGNGTETSKELSSIPNNLIWNSEQCGICYKKFRGNRENLNGRKPYYCSKPTGQEVEVMAVHQKGMNTAAGGGGGEGNMLMEYQFFPGKVGGSFGNDKEVLINMASSKEISSDDHGFGYGVGEGTAAAAAAADSNSIDLSLKLSY